MRTTLTLEEDVTALLRSIRAERRAGLKQVVNEALRLGLQQMDASSRSPKPVYRTRVVNPGRCLIPNVDTVSEVLAWAEGEDFQ